MCVCSNRVGRRSRLGCSSRSHSTVHVMCTRRRIYYVVPIIGHRYAWERGKPKWWSLPPSMRHSWWSTTIGRISICVREFFIFCFFVEVVEISFRFCNKEAKNNTITQGEERAFFPPGENEKIKQSSSLYRAAKERREIGQLLECVQMKNNNTQRSCPL